MKKGRIELHNWEGRLLSSYRYKSVADRKRYMDILERRHIKNIDRIYFQIIPKLEWPE